MMLRTLIAVMEIYRVPLENNIQIFVISSDGRVRMRQSGEIHESHPDTPCFSEGKTSSERHLLIWRVLF